MKPMSRFDTLEILEEIFGKIRDGDRRTETVLSVSKNICALFEAERLTIYVVDDEIDGTVTSIVKTGLDGFKSLRLPIDESSIAGYVAFHKKPLNINDAYDEKELASFVPPATFLKEVDHRTGYRTRQMLTAPILDTVDGTLLGVLQIINSRTGQRFSEVFEQIAAQLAGSLAERFREWRLQDREEKAGRKAGGRSRREGDVFARRVAEAHAKAGGLVGSALDDEADHAKPVLEIPAPITDLVYFSATAPQRVAAGLPFLLGIWAHLQEQRADVLKQVQEEMRHRAFAIKTKGPAMVPRGTILAVRVTIPDLAFEEEDTILWAGQIGNCSFVIDVPNSAADGKHIGTARLAVNGIPITRLHFEIDVGEKMGSARNGLPLREDRPRTAFVSYASENRDEVLSRIQGMQKLMPDLDVFLDIVSLRSGENWEQKLEDEIVRRDVFYLFWSSAARESRWVEAEWRTALRTKGLDHIDPVPLEAPDKAPPPKELQGLHFNEWTLAYRKSA